MNCRFSLFANKYVFTTSPPPPSSAKTLKRVPNKLLALALPSTLQPLRKSCAPLQLLCLHLYFAYDLHLIYFSFANLLNFSPLCSVMSSSHLLYVQIRIFFSLKILMKYADFASCSNNLRSEHTKTTNVYLMAKEYKSCHRP